MRRVRPRTRRVGLELALVAVTAVWGATFVIVKESVARVPPFSFNALRFVLAALALGALCLPRLRRLGGGGWRRAAVLGGFLFAGYAFQTVGLQYTRASTAGFITGMFVVFTPLLSALVLRRPPGAAALAGVALATLGLGLLGFPAWAAQPSAGGRFVPGVGDTLMLGCALSFAAHIVGLGAWSPQHDPAALATAQLAVTGLLHGAWALAAETPAAAYAWDGYVLTAIVVTALLASAGAFWVQTAAQRVVPPTRTAIVLTMEPVFAGLFGYLLLGERLAARGWLGGGLIVAGMLVAELVGEPPDHDPSGSPSTSTSLSAASR